MFSQFIDAVKFPVCISVIYIGCSYIYAIAAAAVYGFLQLLEPLITDSRPLFCQWTFSEILLTLWFYLFLLGSCMELLKYGVWLLKRAFGKHKDGKDQRYKFLAEDLWFAACTMIIWTLERYLALITCVSVKEAKRLLDKSDQTSNYALLLSQMAHSIKNFLLPLIYGLGRSVAYLCAFVCLSIVVAVPYVGVVFLSAWYQECQWRDDPISFIHIWAMISLFLAFNGVCIDLGILFARLGNLETDQVMIGDEGYFVNLWRESAIAMAKYLFLGAGQQFRFRAWMS